MPQPTTKQDKYLERGTEFYFFDSELTQRSPVCRVENHGIKTLNKRRSLRDLNASFYRCMQHFQLNKTGN